MGEVVAVNETEFSPAGTLTVAGSLRVASPPFDSVIISPEGPAAESRTTVISVLAPPTTVDG